MWRGAETHMSNHGEIHAVAVTACCECPGGPWCDGISHVPRVCNTHMSGILDDSWRQDVGLLSWIWVICLRFSNPLGVRPRLETAQRVVLALELSLLLVLGGLGWGMLSGPEDLLTFSSRRSFSTPATCMVRGRISGCGLPSSWGLLLSSLVKTDLNWSLRIWAFAWLSLLSWPFFFRGATPVVSCFLDLMYFQNGLQFFCSSPWRRVLLM